MLLLLCFVYTVIIETQNRLPNNVQKTSPQSYNLLKSKLHPFLGLRWLKEVFSTFQDVVCYVSLLPLVINHCYNHGIKKLPNHWLTHCYHFHRTICYHSNIMTC